MASSGGREGISSATPSPSHTHPSGLPLLPHPPSPAHFPSTLPLPRSPFLAALFFPCLLYPISPSLMPSTIALYPHHSSSMPVPRFLSLLALAARPPPLPSEALAAASSAVFRANSLLQRQLGVRLVIHLVIIKEGERIGEDEHKKTSGRMIDAEGKSSRERLDVAKSTNSEDSWEGEERSDTLEWRDKSEIRDAWESDPGEWWWERERGAEFIRRGPNEAAEGGYWSRGCFPPTPRIVRGQGVSVELSGASLALSDFSRWVGRQPSLGLWHLLTSCFPNGAAGVFMRVGCMFGCEHFRSLLPPSSMPVHALSLTPRVCSSTPSRYCSRTAISLLPPSPLLHPPPRKGEIAPSPAYGLITLPPANPSFPSILRPCPLCFFSRP